MSKFRIRQAEKRQAKLRLALIGVSGSGKSRGAISIALGMEKKFVVIDTEDTSADLYAGLGKFDVLTLEKPFTPERYIDAINYCEEEGYEIIIIDSLSHAWAGEGGLLEMHDKITQASKSKNSYMAWGEITPWHNKLISTILHSSAHIITTMRVKTQYEVINDNGRMKPVKVGLAPIQREGMDYEFTVVLDIDKESKLYSSSKDRTQLFEGKHEKISIETGKKLIEWLNDGKSIEEIENEKNKEIEDHKEELRLASSLEVLTNNFKIACKKFPDLKEELIQIATQRKEEIINPIH